MSFRNAIARERYPQFGSSNLSTYWDNSARALAANSAASAFTGRQLPASAPPLNRAYANSLGAILPTVENPPATRIAASIGNWGESNSLTCLSLGGCPVL